MAVAVKFGAAAMLGLDIDGALVNRACANLSRYDLVTRCCASRRVPSRSDWTATVPCANLCQWVNYALLRQ